MIKPKIGDRVSISDVNVMDREGIVVSRKDWRGSSHIRWGVYINFDDGGYNACDYGYYGLKLLGPKKESSPLNDDSPLLRKWVVTPFNSGYEISQIEDGVVKDLLTENDGDGISKDLELLKYIVNLHNDSLEK